METYELLIISFLLLSTLFWGYYFINVFVAILAVLAVCLFVLTFSNVFEYPETQTKFNQQHWQESTHLQNWQEITEFQDWQDYDKRAGWI